MPRPGNKTTASDQDVSDFVAAVADVQRRSDAASLIQLMQEMTGFAPVMWGSSIVGFGSRHYRYDSGRQGDSPAVAFSPRKAELVLYLAGGLDTYADLLPRLGPHRTGKACLYLKRLDQIDPVVLREVVGRSFRTGTTGTDG